MPSDRPPDGEPWSPIEYTSDVFPSERAGSNRRPVRKRARHTKHAHKNTGRSRYHPRPQPRRRTDVMGFNVWIWVLAVVLIVVLLFWY